MNKPHIKKIIFFSLKIYYSEKSLSISIISDQGLKMGTAISCNLIFIYRNHNSILYAAINCNSIFYIPQLVALIEFSMLYHMTGLINKFQYLSKIPLWIEIHRNVF